MKRSLILIVLSMVFVTGLGLRAEAKVAVTCGVTLPDENTDTTFTLKRDLKCPGAADPAIALGDHTILDLNGHTLTGSGTGDGVRASAKDHSTVKNGTIKNFIVPVFFANGNADHATRLTLQQFAIGVDLFETTRALVSRVHMSNGGATECVAVEAASDSVVQANRMSCTATGVKIDGASDDTLVSGNRLTGGTIGVNINTTGTAATRVVANVIRGGATGVDVAATGVDEIITGNDVAGASSDGIHVASGAQTIGIASNATHGNTHDGIFVQNADEGTSVGDNTANSNGNYGIEATAATDDAGGDKAMGNGQFGQCLFIVCT